MSEISWVKITVDMFDNRKIKQIRGLPEGNNIVLVWIMLLTIAGRCNAGGMIFLTENIAYTAESLARELDFEVPFIKMAIDTLSHFGMIRVDDSEFSIVNWEEYQNVDGMERAKMLNRERQKRWYDRQKSLPNVIPNDNLTQPNATDIDIDRDKEIEELPISNTSDNSNSKPKKNTQPKGVFQAFAGEDAALLDALKEYDQHRKLIKHPMTDGAKKRLITRLQNFPREQWVAILHQSIDKGWQDIYELKEGENNGTRQNKPVHRNDSQDSGGSSGKYNIKYSNED